MSPAGQPHTLPSERDFKSLVSASLRQSQFSFVVSFDFSLRERFFLREREGFAFFDKIILPSFSLHVNHVKLFHLVVLDLRSVRDPGLPPCPDALLRVGVMRGWMMGWWVYWWTELSDGLLLIFWRINFEAIEVVFDVLTTFENFLSVMFLCFACALPCCSFAKISPDVILDYGIKNRDIIVWYKTIVLL